MIWLFDLDNTLVDRDGAFGAWAAEKVATHDRGPSDLAAIIEADGGGFAPKESVATAIRDALGLTTPVDRLIEEMRAGIRRHIALYPGVADLLAELRAAGEPVGIVTNGVSHQQRGKIELTGLDRLVDDVVVSAEVGFAKPDPRTVQIALEHLGGTAADAWMIGDAAHADVAAGRAAATRTGWVSHGRTWSGEGAPDVVGRTTLDVVAQAQSLPLDA